MLKCIVIAFFVGLTVSHGEASEPMELAADVARSALQLMEMTSDSELFKVTGVIMRHEDDLESACVRSLLQKFGSIKACGAVVKDIAQFGVLAQFTVEQVSDMIQEAGVLSAEFFNCAHKSVYKQTKCYKSAATDVMAAVTMYTGETMGIIKNTTTLVETTLVDIGNCFHGRGFSSELVENHIRLCKLDQITL